MNTYRAWVIYGGGSFDFADKQLPDDEAAKAYGLEMLSDASKVPCVLLVMNGDRRVWRVEVAEDRT